MVGEAQILREAVKDYIPSDSPVAMNGKHELHFLHSLFSHIDSSRTFGGLKPVSDGQATMWTNEEGVKYLHDDSQRESDPARIYSLYQQEQEQKNILEEKDATIAKLEEQLKALTMKTVDPNSPEMIRMEI
jgi:hypothetical protein